MEYLLKNLQGGRTYAVQIRSVAGDDVSEWSPTFQVTAASDSTVPRQPTGLTGSVQGSSFVLTWTPPTRNTNNTLVRDIKDYELTITDGVTTVQRYYDTAKAQYSIDDNITDFTTAKPSLTFSVKTRDKTGNLSVASNSVVLTNPVPATPTGVTATTSYAGANIKWTKVADTDIQLYEVYYGTTAGFTPDTTTFSNLGYTGPNVNAVIDTITSGTYYFKVCAVDVFAQRGGFGSSAGATVGGGTAGSITVKDEGTTLTTTATSINFVGGGVVATNSGGDVTVTVGGGGSAYAADIGNGTATSFTITHGLATRDVLVQIYENGALYQNVDVDIRHTSTSAVDLVFSIAPTTNQYRVVILPAGVGGGLTSPWTKTLDNPLTSLSNLTSTSDGGTWAIDGGTGQLRQTDTGANVRTYRSTDQTLMRPNMIIEAEVKYNSGSGSIRRMGIFAGGQASSSGAFLVYLQTDSAATAWSVNTEQAAILATGGITTSHSTANWATLRAEINGGGATIFLNGTFLMFIRNIHWQASTTNAPNVGVYTYGCDATFRNLKIWSLASTA
jgi:hypothetical protein